MKVHIIEIKNNLKNINYIIENSKKEAFLIDSSDDFLIQNFLKKYNLNLKKILITHNHFDHTVNVKKLAQKFEAKIFNNSNLKNFEKIKIDENIYLEVLKTQGHSDDSICFILKENSKEIAVFSGDTLFSFGCGKVFYDFEKLYLSLLNLKKLDNKTLIYSGHNYAIKNLKFISSLNKYKREEINSLIEKFNKKFLPTSIFLEKKFNIFLNSKKFSEFKKLREAKDIF